MERHSVLITSRLHNIVVWGCSKQLCLLFLFSTKTLISYQSLLPSVECGCWRWYPQVRSIIYDGCWGAKLSLAGARASSSSLHRQLHPDDYWYALAPCGFVLQSPVTPLCPSLPHPVHCKVGARCTALSLLLCPPSGPSLLLQGHLAFCMSEKSPIRFTVIFWGH